MTITDSTPAATNLERTPAADAIRRLADVIAEQLGTGASDANGETDGLLDAPVEVTATAILGELDHVMLMPTGTADLYVEENLHPMQQLRAVLDALMAHAVSEEHLRR